MKTPLTISQKVYLQHIASFIETYGVGPSNVELGDLAGTSHVAAHLMRKTLRSKGLIDFHKGNPATTDITEAGRAALSLRPITMPEFIPAETLKERAIKLLVDSHTEGATDFANALGSILSLIP